MHLMSHTAAVWTYFVVAVPSASTALFFYFRAAFKGE
jgi:hypothetical protein